MIKRLVASLALTGAFAATIPAAPVYADGAASTRNIIIGGAAAALLIINHNRKVHEKYAEYDRRQAQLSQENNDAWSAYRSEHSAYEHEAAINSELKKEVAYQHNIIESQRKQLASLGVRNEFIAQSSSAPRARSNAHRQTTVARADSGFSLGWGQL